MSAISPTSIRRFGVKGLAVAIASCVLGLALMILIFGLGPNSRRDSMTEEKISTDKEDPNTSQHPWNVALGNVVVIAPELGLGVKSPKDAKIELSRINTKMEAQLLAVRELYRAESEKNSNLMGGLLLQLTVGSSGEVALVKELGWRITDNDFRKAVVAEVGKWEFQDIAPEGTTINCPLLFVREGMEITTLIRWEKSLGLFEEKIAANSTSSHPVQETKAPVSPSSAARRVKKTAASVTRLPKQAEKEYSPGDSEAGQLLDAF
jgi:hypothetical protein